MAYSAAERVKCSFWYENSRSPVVVARNYRSEYGNHAIPPGRNSIIAWHKSLFETGSVYLAKHFRTKTATGQDAVNSVQQHFEDNPHSSTRRAANALNMSRTTVHRILKDLKWHPYKVKIVQKLFEEDKANRLSFARDELDRISSDPAHLTSIMFSDEAHYHLDGGVNRLNHRYWSPENPNWVSEESLHSPRTTVWAAIGYEGLIGPFFFDGTVNSERYLDMLQTSFFPALENMGIAEQTVFMQDGAPPHWGTIVRDWLTENFPLRWMGRGSPNMPWPPRSPDLTPCDFFLWGYLKSKVYTTRSADIPELKQRIRDAFQEVTVEMRAKSMLEYKERLLQLLENDGSHVECLSS